MCAERLDDDAWHRAIDYPYSRPRGNFIFIPDSGEVRPLADEEISALALGRHPVLAMGSNAAPVRLSQKFPSGPAIPVAAATLIDHDSVYAARQAFYGAIPATLTPSPGTACKIHITFLTSEQMDEMHRSEGVGKAYEVVTVAKHEVACAVALTESPLAYRAVNGALCVDGSPRGLSAVPATDRRFLEWAELDVLRWVAERRGTTVEALIVGAGEPHERHEVNEWLESQACG